MENNSNYELLFLNRIYCFCFNEWGKRELYVISFCNGDDLRGRIDQDDFEAFKDLFASDRISYVIASAWFDDGITIPEYPLETLQALLDAVPEEQKPEALEELSSILPLNKFLALQEHYLEQLVEQNWR